MKWKEGVSLSQFVCVLVSSLAQTHHSFSMLEQQRLLIYSHSCCWLVIEQWHFQNAHVRFMFLHVIGSFKKTISRVLTRHLDNTVLNYILNSDDSITARVVGLFLVSKDKNSTVTFQLVWKSTSSARLLLIQTSEKKDWQAIGQSEVISESASSYFQLYAAHLVWQRNHDVMQTANHYQSLHSNTTARTDSDDHQWHSLTSLWKVCIDITSWQIFLFFFCSLALLLFFLVCVSAVHTRTHTHTHTHTVS